MIKDQKGFTLLELIVAMSIFVMVILSATQIFKNMIDAQRSAASAQDIQESLRYAFETISKDLRSAQRDNTTCTTGDFVYEASAGGDELYYKDRNGDCTFLYLSDNTLMIEKKGDIASTTPSKVEVSNLEFKIGPASQPSVTIKMDIEAEGKDEHKQSTTVQTTVSSRYY